MKRWYWLIPLLLAIVVYAPAPWGELVWDDEIFLDTQLIAFKTIGDVFFPPEGIVQWTTDYYRPVVILSYLLDLWLYGEARVAGLHISNVFYHGVTTFFVWLLARRLLRHLPGGSTGAILTAAIFAVHPIHTESVSWIAGRSDVLAAMFFVPSVTLALVWRDTGAKWALAFGAALYFLALLSKEVAIAALIIVPAALLLTPHLGDSQRNADGTAIRNDSTALPPFAFQFRANIMMWLATAFMFLGATGLYLALRHTDGGTYGMPLDISWLEYAARLERSVAYYLVKALAPWPQSSHVAWDLTPGVVATNGAFLIAVGLTALSILFWQRHRDGLLLLVMMWFGATLAPSLAVAIRYISGTPLAERYLYLPSVAPALLLGIACCHPRLGKWRKTMMLAVVLLITVYSVATVERGLVWTSNLSLWTDATAKAPNHGVPWDMLGEAYKKQHDYGKALEAYQHALEGVNGANGRSYTNHNIAIVYHLQKDLGLAKKYYSRALDENAENSNAHYGLGVIYMTEAMKIEEEGGQQNQISARLDRATTNFESAVRLNPFYIQARWSLTSAFAHQGQYYERIGELEQAVDYYRSAMVEFDALIAQDPMFQSRLDVQSMRLEIEKALQRLAE